MKKKKGCLDVVKLFGLAFLGIVFLIMLATIGNKNNGDENVETIQEDSTQDIEDNKKGEMKNKNDERTTYKNGKIYSCKNCIFNLIKGDESGFSIEIKNRSKKDYSFDIHSMSINGIMTKCNPYTASTGVPSKKKGTMDVEFESEWIDGIEKIEYIDLIIWAYDDAKSFKDFETDIIRIKTNNFKEENKQNGNGTETNGLIVTKEKLDECTIGFSVTNKNKNYVEFDFGNSSINGIALDDDYLFDVMSVSVYPNSKVLLNVDISGFVEKNRIKEVKDAEFSLKIREKGDYFKEKTSKKIKFKDK